jgi:hypothetical protein
MTVMGRETKRPPRRRKVEKNEVTLSELLRDLYLHEIGRAHV